jgi:O-antigen ligase
MLKDHPVFGGGLSGYPGRVAPYHDAYWIELFQYPHNIILNFWSELGLAGLAGFLWIVGRFYAVAAAAYRKGGEWLPAALMAAMAALLVHGLVDVPYFKNDLAFLFWIIVGLAEALRRSMRIKA